MNKKKIIDAIQKVRSENNVYWMDLLRLAFKYAPKESSNIIKKINKLDRKISSLTIKLGK
jgi:hypothetical protein